MTLKRVTYLPTVREVADLPSPSSFEVGVGFYVQENQTVYSTNGSAWVVAPGTVGPQGIQGAQGLQGVQGNPGVDAPQFRGVVYRTSSGSVSFTGVTEGDFINSGLAGTVDSTASVGVMTAGGPTVDSTLVKVDTTLFTADATVAFGLKRTASGSAWCYVVATADVSPSQKKRIGIKLAVNGVEVDASECNVTVGQNDVGKLHSMYLFELDQGDSVMVWFANYTNTNAVTVERARMVLIGVR